MPLSKALSLSVHRLLKIALLIPMSLFAYNGSKTWLYYTQVADHALKAKYESVYASSVLCDENYRYFEECERGV